MFQPRLGLQRLGDPKRVQPVEISPDTECCGVSNGVVFLLSQMAGDNPISQPNGAARPSGAITVQKAGCAAGGAGRR